MTKNTLILPPKQQIHSHFKTQDPIIHSALTTMDLSDWFQPTSPDQYYARLCTSIIGQQLSTTAAGTITQRFLQLFPEENIDPQTLLTIPDDTLRSVGLSYAKARYLKDLSQKTLDNQLPFADYPSMTQDQVSTNLIQVKGIGQWTIDMFLIFALGFQDIFSYSDVGLQRGIQHLYQLKTKPTTDQINTIIKPWTPYKSYASCALWHSLDNA